MQITVPNGLRYKDVLLEFNAAYVNRHGIKAFDSVYDSITRLAFSGGRCLIENYSVKNLIEAVYAFNKKEIGFAFTFSNPNINDEVLKDKECNQVLRECENKKNRVIVQSHILAKYIKKYYPNYQIILSATSCLRTAAEINNAAAFNEYDYIVPLSEVGKDVETLQLIKKNAAKIEVILNERCVYNCPYRRKHYREIDKNCEKVRRGESIDQIYLCRYKELIGQAISKKEYHMLNKLNESEVYNLIDLGFTNFKLSGRGLSVADNLSDLSEFLEILHSGRIYAGV